MFIRIVKFKDGKYAVRRWTFFGYEYLDIDDADYWWLKNSVLHRGTKKEAEFALERWKNRKLKEFEKIKYSLEKIYNKGFDDGKKSKIETLKKLN